MTAGRKPSESVKEIVSRWPKEWIVEWEERAAIVEFDGGLPRYVAESAAFDEIAPRVPGHQKKLV
jgi:hypothetical protein